MGLHGTAQDPNRMWIDMARKITDDHQSVNGMCQTCGVKYPCNAPGFVAAMKVLEDLAGIDKDHAPTLPIKTVGVCAVPGRVQGDRVGGSRVQDVKPRPATTPVHTLTHNGWFTGFQVALNAHRLELVSAVAGDYHR